MNESQKHVVIVGAGIVGISTAIWLQRDGHQVTVVDAKGPAEGASYGNGGVLASCSVVPVTTPGLIGKAPGMLFSPDQPLFLKWGYLPRLLPWLWRYLKHANAKDAARIAAALHPIVGDSLADHQALSAGTGAERWVVPSDYLYIYRDRAHYESDAFGWGLRRDLGIEWEEMEAAAFRAYDPVFSPEQGFAARVGDHGRISDPGAYVKALAKHMEDQGGRLIIAEAEDVARENGQVTGLRAGGETIPCDAVVIAAGVWSGPLAKKLGVEPHLESERGYHLELVDPTIQPKSPVMIASGKFVATPMEGRLRLAGMVEFGGLKAPPSERPFELLEEQARRNFPGIQWSETRRWMGHRPAPADSIPFIGETPEVKGAYLGFGHHHVGLTGGPKTGRILAQLIGKRTPNLDLTPYSPARFA